MPLILQKPKCMPFGISSTKRLELKLTTNNVILEIVLILM